MTQFYIYYKVSRADHKKPPHVLTAGPYNEDEALAWRRAIARCFGILDAYISNNPKPEVQS